MPQRISYLMLVVALINVGFGVFGIFDPVGFGEAGGFPPVNTSGVNEIRANYGGMMLGSGIFLVIAAFRQKGREVAWLMVTLALGGLAAGRGISLIMDGMPGTLHFLAFIAEVIFTVIAWFQYRAHQKITEVD